MMLEQLDIAKQENNLNLYLTPLYKNELKMDHKSKYKNLNYKTFRIPRKSLWPWVVQREFRHDIKAWSMREKLDKLYFIII